MRSTLLKVLKALAGYSDWAGKWVHYGSEPFLKLNPKQFHQDPAAIYLFPMDFKPAGQWQDKRYKFVISVDDGLKVLDLSKLKKNEMLDLARKVGLEIESDKLNPTEYSSSADLWWSALRAHFMGRPGKFNKALRELGFDAIFDDTKSIHSLEIQLLVLNPSKIKVVETIDQLRTGYEEINKLLKMVEKKSSNYGNLRIEKPKKVYESWYKSHILKCHVNVEKNDNYVGFDISTRPAAGCSQAFAAGLELSIFAKSSNPELRQSSQSVSTNLNDFKIKFDEFENFVEKILKKTFE